MLKLLITGLIIYFMYQTFFKKPSLKSGQDHHREDRVEGNPPSSSKKKYENDDDGEYIDYEEVE